jgi:hypothetical protein
VDRADIVAAIQRTAEANGGKPPGRLRLQSETGIRESDWRGKYWARWNDAVAAIQVSRAISELIRPAG